MINKKIIKTTFVIVLSIFAINVSIILYKVYMQYICYDAYDEIKEQTSYVYNIPMLIYEEQEVASPKIKKLRQLQEINTDIVALIEIEETNINYPVLQGKDNSYYMTHNYKKEKVKDGSIFIDKDYDWSLPSTNLLIYGHNNIGSKEMFAELMKYKKEGFYKKHKIINFITSEEEAEYEIISVFLSRVYYKHEQKVFRYYYFINANNKQEFDEYIKNCKKYSLYETYVTAEYGDELMTLSTCEYSRINGRLVIVAKKI